MLSSPCSPVIMGRIAQRTANWLPVHLPLPSPWLLPLPARRPLPLLVLLPRPIVLALPLAKDLTTHYILPLYTAC
jgi:hypothetical protein